MLLIVLLGLALAFFIILVELRILSYAYQKIGVRPRYVFLILVLTLIGSHVNVPLYSVPATHVVSPRPSWRYERSYAMPRIAQTGRSIVAINVGGALIPALLSIYLFFAMGMPGRMLIGTAIVAVVVNQLAQVVPGVGVAVPVLLPPFLAAAVALILAFRRAPPVAYVAGTMGTLIGADLMNLSRVTEMGAPVLSIGGAGTFDGVFLTGILAGLLA
jgi:uncharacterized membrane protein